jgi:hypothetical protein
MPTELNKAINSYGWVMIRQFKALSDDERVELQRLFRRHFSACKTLGIGIDPHFIPEAISDLKKFGVEEAAADPMTLDRAYLPQ